MCGTSQIGSQSRISSVQQEVKVDSSQTEQLHKRPDSLLSQRIPRSPKEVRTEGQQQLPAPTALKRRAGACLVGVGVLVRTLVALVRVTVGIGTVGLSEGLYRGGKAVCKSIYNKATGRQRIPEQQLPFTLPGSGGDIVDLNSSILPKRMPKGMTIEQLTGKIQNKIKNGHRLLQDIQNDRLTGQRCSVEDMTNIMFFLQAKGEEKAGNFSQGSFSIPDPGNKIRGFLDTCKEAYQRESSHVNGFQVMTGGKHRGIDAYGSCKHSETLLPHGMKTLLYGTMAQSEDLQMPNNRLWLKIESHGAWLTSPKGERDTQGPGRTARWHDTGAMFGHSLSFLATRGKGSLTGSFKERIPSSVKNDFRTLIEDAPPKIQNLLKQSNPTDKAMGIRVMVHNVEDALEQVPLDKPELSKSMMNFLDTIHRNYTDLDVRIGNEVILTDTELYQVSTGMTSTVDEVPQGNDSQEILDTIIQPEIKNILQQEVGGEEKVKQLLELNEAVHEMGLDQDITDQAVVLLKKEINSLLDTQESSSFTLPESISINDIKQSSGSNVCYILSTIGAVLNTDRGEDTLKGLMTDNGDTVTVQFANSMVTVNKEGMLNRNHPAPPWVQVLEKACTLYLEKDLSELGSLSEIPEAFGWANSEVPPPNELSNIREISQEDQVGMLKELLREQLTTALNDGKAVTFMRNGHAIALTEIDKAGNFNFHNSLSETLKEQQSLDEIVQMVLGNRGQFCVIEYP